MGANLKFYSCGGPPNDPVNFWQLFDGGLSGLWAAAACKTQKIVIKLSSA